MGGRLLLCEGGIGCIYLSVMIWRCGIPPSSAFLIWTTPRIPKKLWNFLNMAEKEGAVIPCDDLPKAFVLTSEYGLNKVHLTSLNSYTLEKRLK